MRTRSVGGVARAEARRSGSTAGGAPGNSQGIVRAAAQRPVYGRQQLERAYVCSDGLLVAATEPPPRCGCGVALHHVVTAEAVGQTVPRREVVGIDDGQPGPDTTGTVHLSPPEGE